MSIDHKRATPVAFRSNPQPEAAGIQSPGRRNAVRLGAVLVAGGGLALSGCASVGSGQSRTASKKSAVQIPPPAAELAESAAGSSGTHQKVILAGGCFWGVQWAFQHTRGVTHALSGYTGGTAATANYTDTSLGTTAHAQSVELGFDPAVITYGQLLQIFFSVVHDPTTLNRQHRDVGPQYRSALFSNDADRINFTARYIAQLNAAGVYADKIVTELNPLDAFYPAEAYHQDYAHLHPEEPYVILVDRPILANLKVMFPQFYREEPILVNA